MDLVIGRNPLSRTLDFPRQNELFLARKLLGVVSSYVARFANSLTVQGCIRSVR